MLVSRTFHTLVSPVSYVGVSESCCATRPARKSKLVEARKSKLVEA